MEEIVAKAKDAGALTVLDTCQSAAHMPVDVKDLGVDFAVFSSHKMLGPTGVGALWGKEEILEQLPPVETGGSVVADVSMEETVFLAPPARFEAGSQPVAQAVGWASALEYLSELGMDRIAAHEKQLTKRMLDGIAQIDGVRVLGPATAEDRTGVVSFDVEGVHPHDVGQYLDSKDVAVRVGHHCAIPANKHFGAKSSSRASLAVTSTEQEVDQFLDALKEVRSYFGASDEQS